MLNSRALAGVSTGGLPYGYRTRPVEQAGRVVGHEVLVDEEQATIVRLVFRSYADGQSYDSIARRLTAAQVPPPKAKSKRRLKGWVSGTVRAFLRNETYIGVRTLRKEGVAQASGEQLEALPTETL